jgi:ABC-type hemin transport system ATPase subunit
MTDSTQNRPGTIMIFGPTSAGSTTLLRHLKTELTREDTTDTASHTFPGTQEKKS